MVHHGTIVRVQEGSPNIGADQAGAPRTCTIRAVLGDLDGDGFVDGADLGALLSLWGVEDPVADFACPDGVGGEDLGILLSHWRPE